MNEEVRTEIITNLQRTAEILEIRDAKDLEELKELSEHSIKHIAIHKDLELVSVTVLIYSIYKIERCLNEKDRKKMAQELKNAVLSLRNNRLGRYNSSLKILYAAVRSCNARIKEHLQDVMNAARIKKGTSLLQHGLSIGQAAGLMGLSNWDLQAYAGKANLLSQHTEAVPAGKRLSTAFKLFEIA